MGKTNSKKNIAFLINNMSNGGAERIISYLTFGFSNEEFNKFLIIDNRKEIEYECEAEYISLDLNNKNNFFAKFNRMFQRFFKIRRIKKKYSIEKTISFLDTPNLINIITRYNDEIIISIRNCMSEERKYSYLHRKLIGYLYQKADEIIAISEGVKLDLIKNFYIDSNKIKVIYNSINIDKLISQKSEDIDSDIEKIFDCPVIINAGRLTHQKGQWHLIKAFSKVIKEVPNAQLVILGEGELREKFVSLIQQLHLEKNVHLLGYQKNPFKLITRANLFVLTSLFEGFGNVILEAMVCETPVISTDCKYGPREIINPNTCLNQKIKDVEYGEYGILIPHFDGTFNENSEKLTEQEKLLADIIVTSLKDEKLLSIYKTKGLERSKMFYLNNIINQWLEL